VTDCERAATAASSLAEMTVLRDHRTASPDPLADTTVAERTLDRSGMRLAERGAWTLVWFGVLAGAFSVWHLWWYGPAAAALAPLLALAGLAGIVACWVTPNPRRPVFQIVSLAGAVVAAAAPQMVVIATRTSYITDSAAFGELTTRALLRGTDPYRASMAAAARLVTVPDRYWTYTIDGGHVTHASYPAGSFLLTVPAMVLGLGHHAVDATDLLAWIATGVLVFALLPASLRWLGALVLATPALVTMGTDATFLPFLVLAVWRWDRYGTGRDAGMAHWLGPIALGVACAVKQGPWFCAPFLVVGIAIEARRCGRRWWPVVARYVVVAGGVFALVNLPFIVWDPAAWARGSLLPVVQPLVADGQGLVTLATHGLTGGLDLTDLSLAGALAYLTAVAAYAGFYARLKRVWPLLVPLAFFFATRSLSSYLMDLLPVAIVAAATVSAAPPALPSADMVRHGRLARAIVGALLAATVACTVLAFSSAPLELAIRGATTSSAGRVVDTVTVWVRNDTATPVVPHFMVNTGNNPNGFLTEERGRALVLAPHRSATVTLVAPSRTVAPQSGARWLLEAYTTSPAALSTSPLAVWRGR
jgi:uncharacterized membrane protein